VCSIYHSLGRKVVKVMVIQVGGYINLSKKLLVTSILETKKQKVL
jgi:hypothetical protein